MRKDGEDAGEGARKQYIDNIKQWTNMTASQCIWAAEDGIRWNELDRQAMVANDQTSSAENKKKSAIVLLNVY